MCLAVTPLLPFLPFLTSGLVPPPAAPAAPQAPPQQPVQQPQQAQQGQQTQENPNDIQSVEEFMSQFGRIYSSPAEQAFRQGVFTQNLGIINVSFRGSSAYLCLSDHHFLFRLTTPCSLPGPRPTS